MNYARAIKELRLKMMISQMDFAKMFGVSYETVNRWETGKFVPTFKHQRKLVGLFKQYEIELEEKKNE